MRREPTPRRGPRYDPGVIWEPFVLRWYSDSSSRPACTSPTCGPRSSRSSRPTRPGAPTGRRRPRSAPRRSRRPSDAFRRIRRIRHTGRPRSATRPAARDARRPMTAARGSSPPRSAWVPPRSPLARPGGRAGRPGRPHRARRVPRSGVGPSRGPASALVTVEFFFVPGSSMPVGALRLLEQLQDRHPARIRSDLPRAGRAAPSCWSRAAALEAYARASLRAARELGKQRGRAQARDLLDLARRVGADPRRVAVAVSSSITTATCWRPTSAGSSACTAAPPERAVQRQAHPGRARHDQRRRPRPRVRGRLRARARQARPRLRPGPAVGGVRPQTRSAAPSQS